jgi:uncharacterized membrane protein
MTVDKTEAAQALAEISASERRSSSLYGYSRAAPYMALAGLMWLVADLLTQFSPSGKGMAWPIVSLVGTLGFVALAVTQNRGAAPTRARSNGNFWRAMGVWLAIFVFIAATFTVFAPVNGYQVHTFIGVFFGCSYICVGLWMGWRIVATGIVLTGLSLFGFYEVHQYYLAFMGVVGGGALMLGALWLRMA